MNVVLVQFSQNNYLLRMDRGPDGPLFDRACQEVPDGGLTKNKQMCSFPIFNGYFSLNCLCLVVPDFSLVAMRALDAVNGQYRCSQGDERPHTFKNIQRKKLTKKLCCVYFKGNP
jgi:hypothetical protein